MDSDKLHITLKLNLNEFKNNLIHFDINTGYLPGMI